MNLFDRICAVFAAVLGAAFILMGIVGLFAGSTASYSLPPVLGVVPAFLGWGILRSVIVALKASPKEAMTRSKALVMAEDLLRDAKFTVDRSPDSEWAQWQLSLAQSLHAIARQPVPDPEQGAKLREECEQAWKRRDWTPSVSVEKVLNALYSPPICRVCGYDLRASPDRCPECGTETRVGTQPQP